MFANYKIFVIIVSLIEVFIFGGLGMGWISLAYLFKHQGYFISNCPNITKNVTYNLCPEQDISLNLIFTIYISLSGLGCLIGGIVLDNFGLVKSRIGIFCGLTFGLSLLLNSSPGKKRLINFIILKFFSSLEYPAILVISMIFIQSSGGLLHMMTLKLANLIPDYSNIIMFCENGIYNNSMVIAEIIRVNKQINNLSNFSIEKLNLLSRYYIIKE